MITYEEFQKALKIVQGYKQQIGNHYKTVSNEVESISKFIDVSPETEIVDTQLSIRTKNLLLGQYREDLGLVNGWAKIKDLEVISIKKMRGYRGFGSRSINEIKELCYYAGVKLKP